MVSLAGLYWYNSQETTNISEDLDSYNSMGLYLN